MENKTFETTHLIRFTDCDPFNHLNNSRYLDYFINAREDHLEQFHNFSIYKKAKEEGKSWVVSQNQIAYLRPSLLMEKVIIDSRLIKLSERKIKVEMKMWDATKSHIKAILWITFSHFDLRANKSAVHDEHFFSLFKPFELQLETPDTTFEERVNFWRSKTYTENEKRRA